MFSFLKKIFGTSQQRKIHKYEKIVMQINEIEKELQGLDDSAIKAKTLEFRARLQQGVSLDALLPEAYAVVKNVCRRLWGTDVHVSGYNQKWDMIPYDVQLIGAIALHRGYIAEMQTGEGKTVTATMPLYLNALTGKPVHIVTVNDYLAMRDCEWVGSIFRWLGLTTGVLKQEMHHAERKAVYACDIVYGTASEFGFDYLRDHSLATTAKEQVQRSHYFAIIDEVDSILIDEARTPLIISGPSTVSRQMYDLLKIPVENLVQRQREFCNKLALEVKKQLERHLTTGEDKEKTLDEKDQEALKKAWLIGKGTPKNKVLKRLKEDPDLRSAIDKWDLYFYSEQNKEERATTLATLYILIDERANEYELTDKGIASWIECGGNDDDFVMLDLGHEFFLIDADPETTTEEKMQKKLALQEEDAVRKERAHNLRQLLRAHLLMEKDVDYIIHENKVVIIDENTGRPQPGRRFSDGLHQAIEAKEHAPIQRETQTFATVTLQNYFRMYSKLAGMTGTAITEAHEFKEIYKLDVLQIPPNKSCIRKDFNDEMYMTEREKYAAMLKEIKELHAKGQPILLGTESVDVSEKLSRILKMNRLEHTVLNAKQNEKEAEIIAHAGEKNAITIATNMAGRGTDIKLGKGVAAVGGLHVIGSTRHQSRRIDRQLRGRSGRQGDPGSSKFYISLEDPLMRLFATPTLTALLQRFRPPEGEPISAPILNKSIETAQKRIEGRNYMMRKHTLEYDDVMNKQRQEIYAFRNELLHTQDLIRLARETIENVCVNGALRFFRSRGREWNNDEYREWLTSMFPIAFNDVCFDDDRVDYTELSAIANERIQRAFSEKIDAERAKLKTFAIPEKEETDLLSEALRTTMVKTVDTQWQEHLLAMDHLRSDVHLRVVGQKDPLMEFRHEAFALFEALSQRLLEQIAHALFKFHIVHEPHTMLREIMQELHLERNRSFASEFEETQEEQEVIMRDARLEPVAMGPKTGRNDVCPCGSGKKFKKCCGIKEEA